MIAICICIIIILTATVGYFLYNNKTASLSSAEPVSLVQKLMASDVPAFLRDGGVIMVYADWCGHCTAMKPAFRAAASLTKTKFGFLNADTAPSVIAKYDIKGFPHVFCQRSSGIQKYSGDRSMESLKIFANI
jgi:thiol-disulfide isomerase/thioredoxin